MMPLSICAGSALLTDFFYLKEDLRYVALSLTSETSAQFPDSLFAYMVFYMSAGATRL